MPVWTFEDFADVINNARTIRPKYNQNVGISVDKKFLYINDMALPTGCAGASGMVLFANYTGCYWAELPTVVGSTGTSSPVSHESLSDMPDTTGSNTDHDTRYVIRVQPDVPEIPDSFTGMTWYDTNSNILKIFDGVNWVSINEFQGVTGLQGETGISGLTGLIGVTGLVGATGIQGVTGLMGLTGIQGATGAQGVTGSQGVTGPGIGLTGLTTNYLTVYDGSKLSNSLIKQATSGANEAVAIGVNAATDYNYILSLIGQYPGVYHRVERASGGVAFPIFKLIGKNTTSGLSTQLGEIGVLGTLSTAPTAPVSYYLYLGADTDTTYNNNAFRIYPAKICNFQGNVGIIVTDPDEKLEVSGNVRLTTDNDKYFAGTAKDASITYDGNNMLINPKEVGSGILDVAGVLQTDGYNAADGTTGISSTISSLTFKNGILTANSGGSLIGATGSQGLTGSQGITGSQGVTGLIGVTGLRGLTGSQGITGSQGVTGLIGATGSQGLTGSQGITGSQGVTGLIGVTGLRGLTGSQGITGSQGVGITGLTDTYVPYQNGTFLADSIMNQGSVSTSKFVVINSTTRIFESAHQSMDIQDATSYAQGVGGGIVLSGRYGTSAYQAGYAAIKGYKSNSTVDQWDGQLHIQTRKYGSSFRTSVRISEDQAMCIGDPTGDFMGQGTLNTSGKIYVNGVELGVTGSLGLTGLQGAQGVTGIQGVTGSQGVTGLRGLTGLAGTNGTNGTQGVTGLRGVTGLAGTNGSQGVTGLRGLTGLQGVTGLQGSGISGLTTNRIPRAASATTLTNSMASDDGYTFKISRGADTNEIFVIDGVDSTSEFLGLGVGTGVCYIKAGNVGATGTDLVVLTANSGTGNETEKIRVTADGLLKLAAVADAATDTDKFVVFDSSNNLKYRTGDELISDVITEGTFTATLHGVAGSVTSTASYTKFGHLVTVKIPAMSATSSSGGASDENQLYISGLPSAIRPTEPVAVSTPQGQAFLDFSGSPVTTPMSALVGYNAVDEVWFVKGTTVSGWTSSGTKGIALAINLQWNTY
jgi:hypothetical protein